jgi:hypothetical protein
MGVGLSAYRKISLYPLVASRSDYFDFLLMIAKAEVAENFFETSTGLDTVVLYSC